MTLAGREQRHAALDRITVASTSDHAPLRPARGKRQPLRTPIIAVWAALDKAGPLQAIDHPRNRAFHHQQFCANIRKATPLSCIEPLEYRKFQCRKREIFEYTAITIIEEYMNFVKQLMLRLRVCRFKNIGCHIIHPSMVRLLHLRLSMNYAMSFVNPGAAFKIQYSAFSRR
jgi:hypothetical protein